ncbi:hypothetical protein FRC01_012499, partial [Tulasnella sp. 417]
MAKAISDFIVMGVQKLHGTRVLWDKLTKSASTYILTDRMPMDPDVPGQRLQLQKPSAMTDARVKTFFKHLVSSYDGSLPEEQAFRFKLDSRYSNIPPPIAPADPTVHHAAAFAAKTSVPKQKKKDISLNKDKSKKRKKQPDDGFDEEDYGDFMEELEDTFLDDNHAAMKGWPKVTARRIDSPEPDVQPPPLEQDPVPNPHPPKTPAETQPDKPVVRPRPRPKSTPNATLESGTDILSHPLIFPNDEENARIWSETKQYLERWADNIIHSKEQSNKMPFQGLSGSKLDVLPPGGLYSSLSILQLGCVCRTEPLDKVEYDVTFPPNLGLKTVHPTHHVSKFISLITDPNKPLPGAKALHHQVQISPPATTALYLHIEVAVSRFIDEMGMRLSTFMGASGLFRDNGTSGSNAIRTSALTDRFVVTVAAIAFARYLKLVLGKAAKLYAGSSSAEETRRLWDEFEGLWAAGCASLARALIERRSDIFQRTYLRNSLPRRFIPLLDYAFDARPWWNPGSSGVPDVLKFTTKQAVASESFYTFLQALTWAQLSFIERGQILLLLFMAAIQIETGRLGSPTEESTRQSPACLLADAIKSLRKAIG